MLKYKISSFVVIICTIISAYIMISSSKNDVSYEDNKESVIINENSINENSINENSINEKDEISEERDIKEHKDEIKNTEESNMPKVDQVEDKKEAKAASEEKNNEKENKKEQENKAEVVDKGEEENQFEEEQNDGTHYPDSAAVFKVESGKILKSLSLSEKTKLLLLRKKISPVDYAQINNYLLDENKTRGIINTFTLLKARLSDEDYNEVKDIASKYINVDYIEDYISN